MVKFAGLLNELLNPTGILYNSLKIWLSRMYSDGAAAFGFPYPNDANLYRGKTRQGASDVASRSLGQVEAYLTVREVLPEASKGADGVLWRELSGFGR